MALVGLALAYANNLKRHNINYQDDLLVEVIDISDICVYMAYIQLSLYGIPAIVKCGDTISQKMRFILITPFLYLKQWKFRASKNQDENITQETIEVENLFNEVTIKGNCQISLW